MLSYLRQRRAVHTVTRPAEPYTAGNQVARKHGVWAADVPVRARELVVGLFGAETVERHPMIALRAAETWVRVRRAEADIAERGEVLEDGKPHPLLGHLRAWDGYLLAVAREYGMTPRSEAELVRDQADAARLVVDLDAIQQRGREALAARTTETS